MPPKSATAWMGSEVASQSVMVTAKTASVLSSAGLHRAHGGELLFELSLFHGQPLELGRENPQQHLPRDGDHENGGGETVAHPFEKRDLDARELFEIAERDRVGAGSSGRRDAANQRSEGAGNHERATEIAFERLELGVLQHANPEREQDRCDGHICYPHRERGAHDEEPEEHAIRSGAHAAQDVEREPGAETGAAERGRQQQDTEKERNDGIAETGAHDDGIVFDAEGWYQKKHKKRRDGEG